MEWNTPRSVGYSRGQKRALETVVPGDGSPFKATAVSSVDGAKLKGLAALLSVPVCSAGNRQQDLR